MIYLIDSDALIPDFFEIFFGFGLFFMAKISEYLLWLTTA